MKKPSQILEKAALLVFESMSKPYDKIPGCVAIDKVMGYVTLSKEDCLLREETFHYFHLCHPGGFFRYGSYWWGRDTWDCCSDVWNKPQHMKARILGLLFAAEYAKQLGR